MHTSLGVPDRHAPGRVRRILALHGLSWVVGLLVPLVIVGLLAIGWSISSPSDWPRCSA